MKKILIGLLTLFLCFPLMMNDLAFSQETHPVMHPDRETLLRWMKNYETAPKAPIDEQIHLRLTQAAAQGVKTSLSLLNYLQYTPSERNQGSLCGNCWVWTGTGVMEIALTVQNGIKNRFSTQFLDSCYKEDENYYYYLACCGGTVTDFATWYGSTGYAIPWSNTNASFQGGYCNGPITRPCGSIATSPKYPITSITGQTILTTGVGQAAAAANIKNILNQNKGVWYGFYLDSFTPFHTFWDNQNESVIWDPDPYCASSSEGHAVLIVGYDDSAASTADHYWIVLNSWGAPTNRPNGLFHLKMYLNYECRQEMAPGYYFYNNQFSTLSVTFPPLPVTTTGSAGNVAFRSTTLNGTVNPKGLPTTTYFKWGTTTSYGNTTSSTSAGSGTSNVAVSANLTGLLPNTTYHYQLVGTNSAGTTEGSDMTFKTKTAGMPWMLLLQ